MPFPKQEDHIGIKQENRDVKHLSPFPDRKTILVSGSKRGTRMPEDTSRERRCSGLESFLVEVEMRNEDDEGEEIPGVAQDQLSASVGSKTSGEDAVLPNPDHLVERVIMRRISNEFYQVMMSSACLGYHCSPAQIARLIFKDSFLKLKSYLCLEIIGRIHVCLFLHQKLFPRQAGPWSRSVTMD